MTPLPLPVPVHPLGVTAGDVPAMTLARVSAVSSGVGRPAAAPPTGRLPSRGMRWVSLFGLAGLPLQAGGAQGVEEEPLVGAPQWAFQPVEKAAQSFQML